MQDPETEQRDLPRQLDAGALLIGLGALALLVSLFLDWYGDQGASAGVTAWTSFELLDAVLAVLALLALFAVAERFATPERTPRLPSAIAEVAGPVALILILISIIDAPPLVALADPTLEVGIWIALAGAVAMTAGALLANVRVSLVVAARERPEPADAETTMMPEDANSREER